MSAVTVLLPVYNGAAFLRRAIDSVLAQTFRDFELLVIDDGSTDASPAIAAACAAADPRVKVLRNDQNLGLARTLNRGLDEAGALLIARQDADDLSHPERLARQVAFLRGHDDVALLGTQGFEIDARGRRAGSFDKPREADGIAWTMMLDNAFIHTSVLFRRDVARALGGYDPAYAYCQDYELWSRLLRAHRAANLGERLVSCLLHAGSMTETVQKDHAEQSHAVMGDEQRRHIGRVQPAADLALLAQIRSGIPPAAKERVLGLLDTMRRDFLRLRPDAARSWDFRATVARQCGNVLAASGFRPLPLIATTALRMGARYPVAATLLRRARWAGRRRLGL